MKILSHVKVESSVGFGFIQLTLEQNEDLYQLFRLISSGDQFGVSKIRELGKKITPNTEMKITPDTELVVTKADYDGSLTVSGTITTGKKYGLAGKQSSFLIEKNSTIRLTKKKWDYLDLAFLTDTCKMASCSPVVVLLLRDGICEIVSISERCTNMLWSTTTPVEEEDKYFDRVIHGLNTKVDFMGLEHIIIASHGSTQEKFFDYLFNKSVKGDLKFIVNHKPKFCLVDVAVANRENLRSILLHSTILRRLKKSEIRSVHEVEALDRFDKVVNLLVESKSYNFAIISMSCLCRKKMLRESGYDPRRSYIELLQFLEKKKAKIIYFSEAHPWHADLIVLGGVAAMFKGLRNLDFD